MKEVYLLRHAEKSDDGILTPAGEQAAQAKRLGLPEFAKVIASESQRARLTARLLTGQEPIIDDRAGFSMSTPEKSVAINTLAKDRGISFLEAVQQYNDQEVLDGVRQKAQELNQFVDELLSNLADGEQALVVSHDLSISPAMALRGIPLESIGFLHGYVIQNTSSGVRRI
jgi:broad specificity phosphatase PhoE